MHGICWAKILPGCKRRPQVFWIGNFTSSGWKTRVRLQSMPIPVFWGLNERSLIGLGVGCTRWLPILLRFLSCFLSWYSLSSGRIGAPPAGARGQTILSSDCLVGQVWQCPVILQGGVVTLRVGCLGCVVEGAATPLFYLCLICFVREFSYHLVYIWLCDFIYKAGRKPVLRKCILGT
jgi:hypothetical protein